MPVDIFCRVSANVSAKSWLSINSTRIIHAPTSYFWRQVRARVLAQEAHLGRARALEEELAKARSGMDEAREQLRGYDEELALAREGLERARELIVERGDELKAAVEGRERAEEERDEREVELEDVKGQLEEAKERCASLNTQTQP